MGNQSVSLDKAALFSLVQGFAKQLEMYLKRIGLSEDEIRFLDTQGALFYWQGMTDEYTFRKQLNPDYRLYDMTLFIAEIMIAYIHDQELKNEMGEFVEQPSVEKAVDIRSRIGNAVGKENIKFLVENVTRMLTQG